RAREHVDIDRDVELTTTDRTMAAPTHTVEQTARHRLLDALARIELHLLALAHRPAEWRVRPEAEHLPSFVAQFEHDRNAAGDAYAQRAIGLQIGASELTLLLIEVAEVVVDHART